MFKFYLGNYIRILCLWISALWISRLNYCDIEPRLVVGWPKVKLMSDSRFCGQCYTRREPGFDINYNLMNYEVFEVPGW